VTNLEQRVALAIGALRLLIKGTLAGRRLSANSHRSLRCLLTATLQQTIQVVHLPWSDVISKTRVPNYSRDVLLALPSEITRTFFYDTKKYSKLSALQDQPKVTYIS
jgi:hypothetical protein